MRGLCLNLFVLLCGLHLSMGQGVTDADCSRSTVPPSACDSTSFYVPCQYNPNTGVPELTAGGTSTTCAAPQICYKEITGSPASPCGNPPPACTASGNFAFRDAGCSAFYTCVSNGVTFTQQLGSCASGYEFSEATTICEPVATAGCSVTTVAPETTTTTTTTTTAAPETTTTATTTTAAPTTTARCVVGRRYIVETNCRHFRVCELGHQLVTKQCPYRQVFDANLLICRLNTDCGTRPSEL